MVHSFKSHAIESHAMLMAELERLVNRLRLDTLRLIL
jgi:hypothetical protein